jgi:uncharacterized membrane protein
MRSTLPMIGLVVVAFVFVLGAIIFGAAMQSAYVETNQTKENLTLVPYEVQSAWWTGAAVLALIVAMAFAFYYFWR